MLVLDPEQRLAAKVCARLQLTSRDLEQLVLAAGDAALDRLLAELAATFPTGSRTSVVSESVSVNGAAETPTEEPPTTTKVCGRCNTAKPLRAFERHRNTCRSCRAEQDRERQAARQPATVEAVPPFNGAASPSLRRVAPGATSDTSSPTS